MNRTLAVGIVVLACSPVVWGQQAEKPKPLVFPAPVQVKPGEGVFTVDRNTRIVVPPGNPKLRTVAEALSAEFGKALRVPGARLAVVEKATIRSGQPGKGEIQILLMPKALMKGRIAVPTGEKRPGRYHLEVLTGGHAGPLIIGDDEAGCYYGAMTLLQLFRETGEGQGEIPSVTVTDHPYHTYRGIRSVLPRGIPRKGEITHAYYRNLLRLWGFCRLNHVWVQGCSWNTPMRRHPEMGWQDVLTEKQAKEIVDFAGRHFLSMDGSLDFQFLYYKYKHLAEIPEGETWDSLKKKVRKMSRVNPCPSNPETWKVVTEMMEDQMAVLTGDHYAVALDEMYQEYHGSRWGVCPRCKGKDPVKLWADAANRLVAKVLEKGKTPVLGGGMLMREHQGWYKDIYKAIDLVEHRDKIVIYNWSEGHIRRGAMRVGGKRLINKTFSATPFFKQHGYKDVCHLFAGTNWRGRPEMREVKGKLDCHGGFVSYYHGMNYEIMKQRGAMARTIFTAQHLWSPDSPAMDSPEDRKMQRYGEAIADAVCRGKTYLEAIELGRKAYAAPEGTKLLAGGAMGRGFASQDPPVNLLGKGRGERTEGTVSYTHLRAHET